jgi:hypothetical protein
MFVIIGYSQSERDITITDSALFIGTPTDTFVSDTQQIRFLTAPINNSLIEMKLFYKVRFDNFKSLLYLKYVKQVNRRLYIDPNLVVLFYQNITKGLQ